MAITITPNVNVEAVTGHDICFQATSIRNLNEETERYIALPASGTNWTYNLSTGLWKKVSGSEAVNDAPALGDRVYGQQPFAIRGNNMTFETPASPNRNVATAVGVRDSSTACSSHGCFFGWIVSKYCLSSSGGTCSGQVGSRWYAQVVVDDTTVIGTYGVNYKEGFRLRSDGINMIWDVYTSGDLVGSPSPGYNRWVTVYSQPLPVSDGWDFHLNAAFTQNEWSYVTTYKGSYQGSIPLTWSSTGGTLTGTDNNARCFSAAVAGTYDVCVDSDFDDPVCVSVVVSDLYLTPTDFGCNDCVFTNDIVNFTSNGGTAGVLTADGGTILGPLQWQAPGVPATVTLTYTLGIDSVNCILNVVDRPRILNVDGDTITGMVPGESLQIVSNYTYPDLVWYNVDCPNIVTEGGLVTIPSRLFDNCFGAIDCYIQGRLVSIPGQTCTNLTNGDAQLIINLRVIVDPVYPTPEFGGPKPLKWKPETPDYRVKVNEFEGGCDETYLRNRVPIRRWTIRYDGLPLTVDNPCDPQPCCDEEIGFVDGFDNQYNVAQRLDAFWDIVAGNAGYFTLKDYRDNTIWRRVRFEGTMERDHINWRTTQSRNFTLVWHPCCATEPQGGVCRHNTVFDDNYAPTIPDNVTAISISSRKIMVSWDRSTDGVGVKGYHLWVDGDIIDVGNVAVYYHTGLLPTTFHEYKVRAYDFSGNFSAWSGIASTYTSDEDTIKPSIPLYPVADGIDGDKIELTWYASTDNVEVAGYEVMVDGVTYNVGNTLVWMVSGFGPCTFHSFFVRAYDTSGNRSGWSFEAIGHTACGTILDGVEEVYDGANAVIDD